MSDDRVDGSVARDYIGDRGFGADPVYLTDLDRCVPKAALSPVPRRGHWRTLEYEAEGLSGVMLMAGPETGATDVSYPIGRSAWHAVSIGVLGEHGTLRPSIRVLARLSDEETFSIRTAPDEVRQGANLVEFFWRVADLTGRDLELGQLKRRLSPGDDPGALRCSDAWIAYVKLVPLS